MDELDKSLERARQALDKHVRQPPSGPGQAAVVMGAVALTLFIVGAARGHPWMIVLAFIVAAIGGAAFVARVAPQALQKLQGGPVSADRPNIGMGASVESDAVIEPGASVEMGASVGRGAVIKKGAVVRMGASVGRGAVIEEGATVSWGADVGREARVGARAIVGAGAHVKRGAHVPAGVRLFPGADYGGRPGTSAAPEPLPPEPAPDPRQQRTQAVCDKLEAEMKASPEAVREFLGGSGQTVASLRRTSEDLLARERALRAEIDEAAAGHLAEERAAVERRLAAETDEQIRMSLAGALAAMDEVKKQRELLRVGADRLQAEHTRLLYTLEALASQFVRLRSAGKDARATAELEASVAQLRAELDAITDALEQVSRNAPMAALASPPPRDDELEGSAAQRTKERQ